MKDFDFDELDRAVSSALGGRGAESVAAPVTQKIEVPTEEPLIDREEATPARSAVRGRSGGGRVMDVVHPSAAVSTTTVREAVAPVVKESPAVEVISRKTAPMNDFRMVPRSETVVVPAVKQEEAEVIEADDDWTLPVESPFLPDAKVEKRPLGASEPTGDTIASSVEIPVDEPAVLPDDGVIVDEQEAPAEVPEPVSDIESVENESELVPEFDVVEQLLADEPSVEYTGPTAITPQYTPKQSENQESGEIFDTESYHQPFPAQVKKKSPFKVLLMVMLILVLGAAAGAAIYFYILPML